MGISKWDTIVDKAESILFNQVCNCRNLHYPLPKHINIHCYTYGNITQAANHIPYGVPNEHARINRLPKSIQTGDQRFISANTHILGSMQLHEDFELAAYFLYLDSPPKITSSNT